MKRVAVMTVVILHLAVLVHAAELTTASSQELVSLYRQLKAIQGGSQAASTENVVFKRDAATFTFINGRLTFAEPVAGQVLAVKFQGEGKFELEPPTVLNQRQIARFAGSPKLADTFQEATFFFTDDTFAELSKLTKVRTIPKTSEPLFAPLQKQYSENYNSWIDNRRKGYPGMQNLAARILADLTDKSSKGFFLADFKGSRLGDLLFQISWNHDSLLLPNISKGDEVLLLHLKPGEYFEWWSGFHLSSEYAKSQYPDHRELRVHSPSTLIDMQVAKDNTLSATAEVEFMVREGTARVLPFNLNCVLRISSIEDGTGRKLDFMQEGRKLDNDPWVILAEPAKPGEKYKLKISYKEDSTYETRIIYDRGSGLYDVADNDSWYPSFGMHDDRTQFEIRARSPKTLVFLASGTQTASTKGKEDLVTSWKTEFPVAIVGFTYGSFVEAVQTAPNMNLTSYAGKDLPDALKGIESGAAVASIGRGGRSEAMLMQGGLNTTSTVKHTAGITIQAFRLFEFLFGSLPFKSMSVSQSLIQKRGSPSLIFIPTMSLLDTTTQNNLGMQSSGEQRESSKVPGVREMAHQWLEHLVGGKTYHDQWICEGGSDFATLMYLRQFESKDVNNFIDIRRKWLLSKNPSGYRPVDAGPAWLNAQLNKWDEAFTSMYVTLYKGGYIMEMLRMIMYDPKLKNPDGRFIAMMHDFTATYAGQNASTEDFRRIVEKHIGQPMDWFFNEWVYGSETPTYDFSYQLANADAGQTELSVSITQSGVSESFRMKLPVYAVINGEKKFLGLVETKGTQPVKTSVKLPVRPEKILLDPDRSILAEIRQ
jgi:hypothetical protein